MARRAAAESLAFMGLKVGDGYAVYLVQVRAIFFLVLGLVCALCVYFLAAWAGLLWPPVSVAVGACVRFLVSLFGVNYCEVPGSEHRA